MNLAKIIDHTNLKANATKNDIRQLCQEAKKYGFRAVCINPRWVKLAKEELKGTDIKVAPAVDWPCGASSTEVRVFATKKAKDDGVDEIDIVLDIGNFKIGKYKEAIQDLQVSLGINEGLGMGHSEVTAKTHLAMVSSFMNLSSVCNGKMHFLKAAKIYQFMDRKIIPSKDYSQKWASCNDNSNTKLELTSLTLTNP